MPHKQFQPCIDACDTCALACEHCAASCLDEKDVTAMARCIQLDLDCAAICRLAVSYMGRGCRNLAAAHPRPSRAGAGARPSAH